MRFVSDPEAYAERLDVTAKERKALIALDGAALDGLGVHPFMAFIARLRIERERGKP